MDESPDYEYENYLRKLARKLRIFSWVTAHLIKITIKDGNKLVSFELNRVQRVVDWHVRDMEAKNLPVRLMILKGRQFGISTYFIIRAFIRAAIFFENCLILAHREGAGRTMFKKAERAYQNFPKLQYDGKPVELIHPPEKWIKGDEMRFHEEKNSGEIIDSLLKRESAENIDAGVSETYQHLHLTEMPLWRDARHTMHGLLPTIDSIPGTSIVMEFTARGVGDYTHTMWVSSKNGETEFRAVFLAWYWFCWINSDGTHGGYHRPVRDDDAPLSPEEREYMQYVREIGYPYPLDDDDNYIWDGETFGFELTLEMMMWRRDRIASYEGDVDKFRREFPACDTEAFQSSGQRVIPPTVMDRASQHMRKAEKTGELEIFKEKGSLKPYAKFISRPSGRLFIFERPKPDSFYLIDDDPSSGVAKDPSGIHVLKVSYQCVEEVASFRGKLAPHENARLVYRLGKLYRNDMALDINKRRVGGSLPLAVIERNGFGEAVIRELKDVLGYHRIFRYSDKGADNWTPGHRYGFPVSTANKKSLASNALQMLYEGTLILHDRRSTEDIRGLIWLDDLEKQFAAMPGSTDDLAMAVFEGSLVAQGLARFKFPQSSFDDYDSDDPFSDIPEREVEVVDYRG